MSLDKFHWYALHTKPRHEHLVNSALRHKGFAPFFPVRRSRRRWSDRIKEIEQALFPGYVFCRFDVQNRLPILTTPGVDYVVGSGRTPIPIADSEIESLQAVQRLGLHYQLCPYFHVGQRVRVEYGSLANLEGLLVRIKNQDRLVVSVTLLQRSVAVEIDSTWVRPLEERAARPQVAAAEIASLPALSAAGGSRR
jgi:transcription antitermination factor NusG